MSTNNRNNSKNRISESNFTGHESDEFNIKSHLNTSLDIDGINVTEELIQKTLNAINDSETDLTKDKVTADKDSIPGRSRKAMVLKYSRIFAGVAAAVIILVIGINNVGIGKKGSSDMNYSLMSEGTAADKTTASESTDQASTDMQLGGTQEGESPKAKKFAVSEDTDMGSGSANESALANGSETSGSSDASTTSDTTTPAATADTYVYNDRSSTASAQSPGPTNTPTDSNTADTAGDADTQMGIAAGTEAVTTTANLTFQDIAPAKLIQITSITITDVTADKKTSLTIQSDIQNFYDTLEQQQFHAGTASDNSFRYTIKVYGSDSQDLFTMKVGDTVTISPAPDEADSKGIYIAPDKDAFLKLISTFCK